MVHQSRQYNNHIHKLSKKFMFNLCICIILKWSSKRRKPVLQLESLPNVTKCVSSYRLANILCDFGG